MKRKLIVLALVGCSVLIAIGFFSRKSSVEAKLPAGVSVVNVYTSSGLGNGDSIYAFKAVATERQYMEFCDKIGVSQDNSSDQNAIGYSPTSSDVPALQKEWWDEPTSPKFKSFGKQKRGFKRASYANGFIYYYSMTW